MYKEIEKIKTYLDYSLSLEERPELINKIFHENDFSEIYDYFFVDKFDRSYIESIMWRASKIDELESMLKKCSDGETYDSFAQELEIVEFDDKEYDIYNSILEMQKLENKRNLSREEMERLKHLHTSLCYFGDKAKRKLYDPNLGTQSEMKDAKPLSENDAVCKFIQSLGTYLAGRLENVYPPERDLEPVDYTVRPRKKSIFKSRKFKVTKHEGMFKSNETFERHKHESKFPQFLSIDRSECREEAEHKMSKLIHDMQKLKIELEQKKEDGNFTLADSKLYKDVNEIAMEIMHSKHRFIKMRMLLTPSTVIDFEQDTGYIDDDDEYKHISYNAITFSDPQHVAGFVTEYPNIKHFAEDREHPLFYHMETFHDLFNKIVHKLSYEERHILDWYMLDGLQVTSEDENRRTVTKVYNETFGETLPISTVSDLLNKKVPKLIANQYSDEYEEYVYTHKIKGTYHRCSKCGEVKLAFSKNFGKDKRNKNGLKSICKVCDRNKK